MDTSRVSGMSETGGKAADIRVVVSSVESEFPSKETFANDVERCRLAVLYHKTEFVRLTFRVPLFFH